MVHDAESFRLGALPRLIGLSRPMEMSVGISRPNSLHFAQFGVNVNGEMPI